MNCSGTGFSYRVEIEFREGDLHGGSCDVQLVVGAEPPSEQYHGPGDRSQRLFAGAERDVGGEHVEDPAAAAKDSSGSDSRPSAQRTNRRRGWSAPISPCWSMSSFLTQYASRPT